MSNWSDYFVGSVSEGELVSLAQKLAHELFSHDKIFIELYGNLGMGKTTFARSFISTWLSKTGESSSEEITSPTYNLVRVYGRHKPIAHLDLYRLEQLSELEQIGYESYFYETPATLIEWPDRIDVFEQLRPQTGKVIKIIFDSADRSEKRLVKVLFRN